MAKLSPVQRPRIHVAEIEGIPKLERKLRGDFLGLFLGVALGTGYMTSLRFMGPIGFSEVLFLFIIAYMMAKKPKAILRFNLRLNGFIKIYLFISFLFVFPLTTFLVLFLFPSIQESSPLYVFSFIAGLLIAYLILEFLKDHELNMVYLSRAFFLVFFMGNCLSLVMGYDGTSRYSGFSENPNQLLFYLSSLVLLLSIYDKKLLFFGFPFLMYIGFISGSDAYILGIFVTVLVYFYARFFYSNKLPLCINLFIMICGSLIIIFIYWSDYGSMVIGLWTSADEGGARVNLMANALNASSLSPFFGWGAGSFSGIDSSFSGSEAHNNFLDLSMQFGFLVPCIVYGIVIFAMIRALKRKQYLVFSFMSAFLVSGLFHFSARHFVFWVEVGVLLYYVLYSDDKRRGKVVFSDSPSFVVT